MEYVGRRVKKEILGQGTIFGSIESYELATGRYRIVYDDGGSEELGLSEVLKLLVSMEPQNQRGIDDKGKSSGNLEIESGVCGKVVGRDGNCGEFDLNLNKGPDLNDDECIYLSDDDDHGGNKVGGGAKLHDLDLNEGLNLELDEGLALNNKGAVEERFEVKKEIIDLNLDANEDFENLSDEREGQWFDLNLESTEVEAKSLDDCEGPLGENDRVLTEGDTAMRDVLVEDDNKAILVNVDVVNGKLTLNLDNKEESPLKNNAAGVDNETLAQVSTQRKKRGRKRKDAMNNIAALATPETVKVDFGTGNIELDLEYREETPLRNGSDSVDCNNGILESAQRGRRGRKRRELSDDAVTLPTPGTGLRRSSRRAKIAAFSDQYQVSNATGLNGINDQLSSPALSVMSDEKVSRVRHGKSTECDILPPKVEFPPSSCNLDLKGVSVFDLVSVYAFLRSFSTLLFLSPFELGEFVASVKCNNSTLLFDSIHVSLLRILRKLLESLSSEGSASASDCLRSLNWDFLDLITWPMFLVEYLLLHSPGYIPGLDLSELKLFQSDYYKMPVSAKVEILRHLCDDVLEVEAVRSEVNRRTVASDRYPDLERNVKFESSRKRKNVIDVASNSCITEEDADGNSDECCLCKMDGNLICCDSCPAAFHSRCVGVVSSLLPEGDWYCPECAIEKDKPWMKVDKSIRGAELLGIDPYGRHFYSSCGYLLVLESTNDEYSFWSYDRNDLPTLIETLESSLRIYEIIICAISKHWCLVRGTRNDVDTRSYSLQSAFPKKVLLNDVPPISSETFNNNEVFDDKRFDDKLMVITQSSNTEVENAEHVTAVLESGNHGVEMENLLATSEGSAEVSQTLEKTDTLNEDQLGCSKTCKTSTTLNVEKGKNLYSGNYGYAQRTFNSEELSSQVHSGINYVNCYEFARTASSVFEELTSRSLDKTSLDSPRSVEEVIACQLKIVSNRFAGFSWSNIQNSKVNHVKEKCGWCLYCRVPEDERECLCIMNERIPSVENFTCEVLGIKPIKNRQNHLIDAMCHIICIEDHLQGLLLGPWLNPHYSMHWRKTVLAVTGIYSLKDLLLKLESNLHHLALSADWKKHVDSVATMGSAAHIISKSARASSRNGNSSKRAKSFMHETGPSSNAATGLSLFWWRGGRASRELFNWKVLPRSLASKAARQGGRKKIPSVLYTDSGEYAKRTKYASWRAAVEMSRSVEQLALLVRELDANIRWNDIGNTNSISKMDKESVKSMQSFKKVIIRRKCSEGAMVKYLLDFGKRRFIPNVVVKHGSKLEDSSSERKKYWLEESHVPLHLLKAFEEKRIARKSNQMKPGKLRESRVVQKAFKKKGFAYLFSRAERSENHQCGHCHKDVLIREAVSCQYCQGFFHKRHVKKYAGSITSECTYSCQKCQGGKSVKIDARSGVSESSQLKIESKRLKPLCTPKEKRKGKKKKPVKSKNRKRVPLVIVPLRRSARNAGRVSKLSLPNTKVKKRKKGKQAKSGKRKSRKLNNGCRQKKRSPASYSYWLNGLQLSRTPNDESVMFFKSSVLLVLSGQVTSLSDADVPKCILCCELEYKPELNYVACEMCGVWFHGDAFNLGADKIDYLIGFKCHKCLNKSPPVCPHHFPTGTSNIKLVSENKAENECMGEDSNILSSSDDRSSDLKFQSIDKSKDVLLTVNDSVELGEAKRESMNVVETVSTIPNSDIIGGD